MANLSAKASRRSKSESRWAYLMVAPTIIGLLVLTMLAGLIIPML